MSSWKESNILFLQNSTKVGSQIIGKMMIEVQAVFMMQDGLHLSLTIKDLLKKQNKKNRSGAAYALNIWLYAAAYIVISLCKVRLLYQYHLPFLN